MKSSQISFDRAESTARAEQGSILISTHSTAIAGKIRLSHPKDAGAVEFRLKIRAG
jgi:hypothetical protein